MNENYIEHIAKTLSERDLLEQLAEEASELSQAALKLIRAAKYSDNVTPVKEQEAIENLVMEFNDVLLSWEIVIKSMRKIELEEQLQAMYQKQEIKLERWAERLGYEE